MRRRETRAFAIAPLPALVPLLLAIGVNSVIGDTGDAGAAGILLAMLAIALFSYGSTFVIGLPIHLVLRHFQKRGLFNYLSLAVLPFVLLAGAIAVWLQLAPAPVLSVNPFGLYTQGGVVVKWTLAFAAVAALSATTFWYAGVREPQS